MLYHASKSKNDQLIYFSVGIFITTSNLKIDQSLEPVLCFDFFLGLMNLYIFSN